MKGLALSHAQSNAKTFSYFLKFIFLLENIIITTLYLCVELHTIMFVKVKNSGHEMEGWASVRVETSCSDRVIDGLRCLL